MIVWLFVVYLKKITSKFFLSLLYHEALSAAEKLLNELRLLTDLGYLYKLFSVFYGITLHPLCFKCQSNTV